MPPSVGAAVKDGAPAAGRAYSPALATYVVAVLFVSHVINYMDRLALAVLLPTIKAEFGLSDLQLGLLTGIAFTLCYALFGVAIARIADKGNRRNVIGAAILVWSGMTALTGAAQNFLHLVLTRIGVGAGEAGGVPPAHSMIVDIVPPRRRAAVLAFFTTGMPIGSLLGLALGGWLGSLVGWRATFVIFGAVGIVVALLLYLTVPEPKRTQPATPPPAKEPLWSALGVLFNRRAYLFTLIGLAFAGFAMTGLLQWLPSFYTRTFELSPRTVGLYFGLAYGLGSMTGILVGGPLGDHLIAKDRRWPLWMASLAYVLSFPVLLGALFAPSFEIAMALTFIGFAIVTGPFGVVYAMVQSVVPPHLRALAVSLTLFASSLIGAGFGPLLIGWVSDISLGMGATNPLQVGVLAGMAFFPFPAIVYLIGAWFLGREDDYRHP